MAKWPARGGPFPLQLARTRRLHRLDIRCLQTLRSFLRFEGHLLVFLQALEALRTDLREVREQIVATFIRRDETKTLCIVEPFDRTCCHFHSSNVMCHIDAKDRRTAEASCLKRCVSRTLVRKSYIGS